MSVSLTGLSSLSAGGMLSHQLFRLTLDTAFRRDQKPISPSNFVLYKLRNAPPCSLPPSIFTCKCDCKKSSVIWSDQFPPNALRRKRDPMWRGGFSLGVDLGMSRTGLALSKGYSIRPLTVLKLRGEKLETQLLEIAEHQEVDEFIVGLPKSYDGNETPQSNKVRSIVGRLANRAAERGWRVYLQDEHGSTEDAKNQMISEGVSKSTRAAQVDAYAAMMVLRRYFAMSGQATELVLPKHLNLRQKLVDGPPKDIDFFPDG